MITILSVLLMIAGIVIPCTVFGPYQKHVSTHHTGKDEETIVEALIFSFGFTCIALFPIGLITLIL